MMRTLLAAGCCALAACPAPASAQDATTPGALTLPHPTLEHVSIEWAFSGDDDGDGSVSVRFREAGGAYRDAMPLFRTPAGSTPEGFSWASRHVGSLFGLRPGTTYEVELTLTDPDGGSETRSASATTRPVPTVADDAPQTNVTPSTVDQAIRDASPGDVLVLQPGTYGAITVNVDGAEGRPLVLRGSAVGDVIIDGELRMDGRSHVWIEEVTVLGQIKFNNSANMVVRGCRVEARTATGDGIVAYGEGSRDGYFADNTVIGRTTWTEASLGSSGDNLGEGIAMTGPGNVIEHNYVFGFRDCISLLEDGAAVEQVSVDILRNDLDTCADDAIEADFAMGNVRVIENRMVNSNIALSSQPGLGGPTWFIRNVSFNNIFQFFKPNRGSVGDVLLHNTVVKPGDAMAVYAGVAWSRMTMRNNLFLGGSGGGDYNGLPNGDGRVLDMRSIDEATADFDYDGYGSVGTGTFRGQLGATAFTSLAELRSRTTETHAVEVDLGVFAAAFAFPDDPLVGHAVPDLRLDAGSNAVDVGVRLDNVNDGFAGSAPDLGAYEVGAPVPRYGPRGAGVCGDSVLDPGEGCDDGGTVDGDGCSAACAVEPGADAGSPLDGGPAPRGDDGSIARDAGAARDGGVGTSEDGCGCRVVSPRPAPLGLAVFAAFLFLASARRRPR